MTIRSGHDVISSDKVEGTTVYNTAGDKLGSVDDLMIDKVSGQIRYAVLEFGGFLGMGTDRYPLALEHAEVRHGQRGLCRAARQEQARASAEVRGD